MRKPPTHSSGPICATVAVVILAQLAGTGSAAAQIIVGSVARSASADLQIVVAAGGRLPRSVEGWRNDPSILQFVVSNTGTTDLEDLHLSFRVNGTSRGEIVRSAEGHPAQIRFVVSAYETRPFFWDEVLSTEAITAASGIAGSFVRDGIPEDSYQLCASLIDAAGNNITSGQERCVFLRISDPDPPSLVFPTNEANVTAEAAMFQWTPVDADQVSYRLVVKPRFEGQTAGEAMQVNGILLETETAGSSYTYLPSDPPFDTFANADSWVWQVRSLSNDEPVGRNEGFSRIEGFRTSRSLTGVAELRDPPTVVIPTCGQDDRPPQPANRTPSTTAGPDFIGRRVNVGFFQMEITDAQGDGVSLSGSGTIDVPFFETSVPVRFSGLAVNTDSEVFDGVITTANEETARVPLTWSNAEVVIRNVSFRPTGAVLDAALEFSVPSVDVVAGFAAAALTFYPTGVNSRTARLGLPQDVSIPFGNGALRLMGVTSEGAGSYAEWTCNGLERIQLTVQQDFSREWLQPVDGSGAVLPGAVTATYQVALSAESGRFEATGRIPRTQIGGAPGFILDEADVILDFSTDTNPEGLVYPEGYLGDTSPRWQGVYMPSFRLSLPDAIRSYGRTEPVTTTADRLIIDRSGVTVSLGLENILTLATGDLGGWSYSIDRFGLDIVSGSMKEGSMSGQVIVPIGDQPLTYTARLTPVRKPGSDVTELAFDFQIQPSGELRASLFGDTARMTLSPTSRITVEVFKEGDKRVFRPKAILNGTFGIATKVALAGVKFEGFTLQTVDPYVQKGTWSFASPQHYLGGDRPLFLNGSLPTGPPFETAVHAAVPPTVNGLPISITDVTAIGGMANGVVSVGIRFKVNVSLPGADRFFAATSAISVLGKLTRTPNGPLRPAFDRVVVDNICASGGIAGVVELKQGSCLTFFENDRVFGTGAAGSLSATLMKTLSLGSNIRFGNVSGFDYFYLDADAVLQTGVAFPVITAIGFYGFKGGVYYHMRRQVASGGSISYLPDRNVVLGLKAGVILGTMPRPNTLNGDVNLEGAFTSSGGVSTMSFFGAGYMMVPIVNRPANPPVRAQFDITYDFPRNVLDGTFGLQVNAPALSGGGTAKLYASASKWYLRVGVGGTSAAPVVTSWDRVRFTVAGLLNVNGYMATGSAGTLPPMPSLPYGVPPLQSSPNRNMAGITGVLFGAGVDIDVHPNIGFAGADVTGAAAFDVLLADYSSRRCNGQVPGINGWYATGQMGAYLKAKGWIGVSQEVAEFVSTVINETYRVFVEGWWAFWDWISGHWETRSRQRTVTTRIVKIQSATVPLVEVNAGASFAAGMPNPTWFEGNLRMYYTAFGIRDYVDMPFSTGTICRP